MDPHAIVEWMLDGVIARVREHVPWRPGARRLLTELNDLGVPCALVTMSWRRLADAILEELAPIHFDVVVTGDDVRDGKPHPEPYLSAARGARRRSDRVRRHRGLPDRRGVGDGGRLRRRRRPAHRGDRAGAGPLRRRQPEVGHAGRPRHLPRRDPAAGTAGRRRGRGGGDDTRRRWALVGGAAVLVVDHRGGDRRRASRGGGDEALPPRQPGPLDVQAWTPYWALDTALPDLEARADTIHQLSPFWFRATGVDTIEVEAQTPTDQAPAVHRHRPPAPGPARRVDPRRHQGRRDGRHPRRPGRSGPATSTPSATFAADGDYAGLDIDYEQFAFADGRDTWAATRPNWVAFIDELSQRLHARRAHADGEHPAGVRRRPDGRQRLLGLRLRRHHAARRHHPRDGLRLLGPLREPRPDRPARLGARRDPLDGAGVGRRVEARPRHPAVRLQLGRRHDRAVPGDRRGQHQPVAARHGRPRRPPRRDAAVRRRELRDDVHVRPRGHRRRDVVHAVARGPLRRRQRRPDPHAGRHRRRVPRRRRCSPSATRTPQLWNAIDTVAAQVRHRTTHRRPPPAG